MPKPKRRTIPTDRLVVLATGESFQCAAEPPIGVGSVVRLNSGSPRLLVVDVDGENVTVAWQTSDGSQEMTSKRVCFHRCREI